MLLQILLMILGFGLLIKGADWLVDGASALARKFHISDLAIGLTIVAFGTSAPELVVNTFAAFEGHSDIVFGNVIGSNNFNLFLILGIAGIITPLAVQSSTVWKEIPLSLVAAILLFFLVNDSYIGGSSLLSRIDGLILIMMFAYFLYYVYKNLREEVNSSDTKSKYFSTLKIISFIFIGLAGLIGGGKIVVYSAIELATTLGVSQKIIGLTIVAAGTSLPELATSVVAAVKKNNDIAIGNIIGSNIFNIFLILGVSALIKPVQYSVSFNFDLYLLVFGTILLFVTMFTGQKKKLDRWEAVVLVVVFLGYLFYLIRNEA